MKLLPTLFVSIGLVACGSLQAQPMLPPGGPGGMGAGASQQQRTQIQQLQTQLTDQQAELKRITDDLEKEFQKKPEWQEADAALTKAQADHEAAKSAVLTKVYETPAYKAALEKKFDAEAQLDSLTGTDATPEQIQEASNAVMESSAEVRKMEDDALAADPAVQETTKTVADATAAVNALKKEFKESLELNERYLTQYDQVEDTKFKLVDAKQRMADANRKQNQSKAKQNQAKRPKPSKRPSGGGGGMPGMGGY